ncbi:MAG: DegQ family serine endoprotease [Gammaproteobacteria bacterium]|nr:DegQ family serine endoprotease [Gammaproteobacteria bacterium]
MTQPNNPRSRFIAIAAAATLITGAAALPLANSVLAKQTQTIDQTIDTTRVNLSALPGSFADLVETVRPAVVNISTTGSVKLGNRFGSPEFNFPPGSGLEEFFRRFGGPNLPQGHGERESKTQALGSGFIVDASGYVVTNNHVIDGAEEITVILADGTRLEAEVKGKDKRTDLALLKVKSDEPLPHVSFGNSESARVGDWVIAIGNPFGLGGSTTTGIISARGRDINAGPFDDFLQIDAPINRGNSGGPLFNAQGEVIGVNTAIFSPNGGSVGIGFAIPSSTALNVIDQLRADGLVKRGWLGVQIQMVTEDIAESLGIEKAQGALVADVVPDSPAEKAGLSAGDVIVKYDGKDVETMRDLPKLVAATKAGDSVKLEIVRDSKSKTLSAKIDALNDNPEVVADNSSESTDEQPKLGLALAELTDEYRSQYRIDDSTQGVLVVDVQPGSPAAKKGLRQGDVIVKVGGEFVEQPQDIIDSVKDADKENRETVLLLIDRGGNSRFVAVGLA